MALRHHTNGNSKPWQLREPAHALGNRMHVHGKIRPLEEPSWLQRLLGRRL